MKTICLLFIAFFSLVKCYAQDTVERKNRLTDSVIERYFVLKSDPQIKQGPYKALFRRRTVIASGNYNRNKKTGTWQFFDTGGNLIEKYNYDKSIFTYEAPLYVSDDLSYILDDTVGVDDKLTRPIKIGGIYYGYIPYVSMFQLPFDTTDIETSTFDANIELLISPLGRLAEYKIHLISRYYQYDQTFKLDIKLFNEADRTFVPATLNGKSIISRIVIKCYVTPFGSLIFIEGSYLL